jgi:hypothetical protein
VSRRGSPAFVVTDRGACSHRRSRTASRHWAAGARR